MGSLQLLTFVGSSVHRSSFEQKKPALEAYEGWRRVRRRRAAPSARPSSMSDAACAAFAAPCDVSLARDARRQEQPSLDAAGPATEPPPLPVEAPPEPLVVVVLVVAGPPVVDD